MARPATAGEILIVSYDPGSTGDDYIVQDPDGGITNGEGCAQDNQFTLRCPAADVSDLALLGGRGNDILFVSNGEGEGFGPVPAELPTFVYGGGGADELYGGLGGDVIQGGPGNDEERGRAGADDLGKTLDRGLRRRDSGRDQFVGGVGPDLVDARDEQRDELIACGIGNDSAKRDRGLDPPAQSC